MTRRTIACCLLILTSLCWGSLSSAHGPAYADPKKTDDDFAIQGEYVGELATPDGKIRIGTQVIALGNGKFRAVGYMGGLPGDGWSGEGKHEVDGQRQGDVVVIDSDHARAEIRDGVMSVHVKEGDARFKLDKVERQSPTLGEKPPTGAVVLFDGKNVDAWEQGRMSEDGLLMQGARSKAKFGSQRLHIEFRLPYQPEDRGQARGNSGVYLQGRYEVQMLDSFGLEGKDNECGGLYSVKSPSVNMCFPPLAWQTYDIDYTAAKYDGDGKLTASPRITVRHNGVLIHDNVELPGNRSTTAAPVEPGPEPGPIYLQDHGNPLRYRNIWVVPKS